MLRCSAAHLCGASTATCWLHCLHVKSPFHKEEKWLALLSEEFPNHELDFRTSDLGDLYHVYGVNADYDKYKHMLVSRGRITTIK